MDELMRHQPMLKPDAMKAIVKVWGESLFSFYKVFSTSSFSRFPSCFKRFAVSDQTPKSRA